MTEENRNLEPAARAPSLASQGAVVSGMTMLSRISGLIRDVFFAYLLGATQFADIFLVAFRIPNFFRRMFAEGAFNQAFVPVMVRFKTRGHAALLSFLAPLSGLFTLIMVLVVILGMVFSEALAKLFAIGFSDVQIDQTAHLVVITFPYLGFISLTAYASALLNAHGRFAIPAVTPVLLNLVLIGASLVAISGLADAHETEVLAWGVLVAGVVQFLFQIPSLSKLGLITKPNLDYRHEGIRRIGKLLVPALFASSVSQINALVNTLLASLLMTGSISWLYYADRLLELPVGLIAIALGTVMLPHLSKLAGDDDQQGFHDTVGWGINLGLMLALPAAVALYLMADGLIATLYLTITGGALTEFDVRMAGYAVQLFAIAMPGFVLVRVLSTAFFAHEDTQTPFRYAAVAVVANLIVSLATYQWMGHVGLAWATAISAWTNVVLLYGGLRSRGFYSLDASLARLAWRSVLATAVLAVCLKLFVDSIDWLAMAELPRMWTMLAVCTVGVGGYLLLLFILGIRPSDINHYSENQA